MCSWLHFAHTHVYNTQTQKTPTRVHTQTTGTHLQTYTRVHSRRHTYSTVQMCYCLHFCNYTHTHTRPRTQTHIITHVPTTLTCAQYKSCTQHKKHTYILHLHTHTNTHVPTQQNTRTHNIFDMCTIQILHTTQKHTYTCTHTYTHARTHPKQTQSQMYTHFSFKRNTLNVTNVLQYTNYYTKYD